MSALPGTDSQALTSRLEKLIQRFEDYVEKLELKNNALIGGEAQNQDNKLAANSGVGFANGEVDNDT